jgi:hypothetical protein
MSKKPGREKVEAEPYDPIFNPMPKLDATETKAWSPDNRDSFTPAASQTDDCAE